jgi:hypothetical protein
MNANEKTKSTSVFLFQNVVNTVGAKAKATKFITDNDCPPNISLTLLNDESESSFNHEMAPLQILGFSERSTNESQITEAELPDLLKK